MTWFRRRDPRVRDELRYHRDRLIEDYLAAGMDRQAAERKAFLEFGNVTRFEEEVKDARGRLLADLLQDLRYASRTLRRAPGFAVVAILSLALGIGANAGIFSVVNGVMLRALPVADPGRLVLIARLDSSDRPLSMPFPFFERLRDGLQTVSGTFAVGTGKQTVVVDGQDELIDADHVSGSYFEILGLQPAAGRLLSPADDVRASVTPAAVISDRYWQQRFGRDPGAIGKTIKVGDRLFTIVGVTPPAFHSFRPDRMPAVMLPLQLMIRDDERLGMDWNNFTVLARLAPGATVAQTNAEVQALYRGFVQTQAGLQREKDRPAILKQRAAAIAAPGGFTSLRYDYGRSLLILMASVGLVLLLACVNLAGLLLARGAARQREIAIRLSIGAARGRLVRQLLTESLVLAAIGASAGLVIAGWLSARLFSLLLGDGESPISVAPDWRVVAFTAIVAVAACLLAGLIPALHAVRANVVPALKTVRARGSGRAGAALVIAQLAISMVLLVVATLFIATLVRLHGVDRGLQTGGVVVATVRSAQPYPDDRIPAVKDALLDHLKSLPGVRSASAMQVMPLGGGLWARTVQVEGYRFRDDEPENVGFNAVAPAYFATLGTPLPAGREFEPRDTATSTKVAIVNTAFAKYFFGTARAIGRHVTCANVTYEIVGIAGDAKYQGLRAAIVKTMYIPWTQRSGGPSDFDYIVRAAGGDPRGLLPDLRRAVSDADPALRLRTARAYDDLVDASISTERIMATLGGVFGVLAMIVAAVGLFGLLMFQVTCRTNEIGVRMALGATRSRVMARVLREVALVAAPGIGLGALAAFAASGAVRSLLFGVTPTQPSVFVVAASVLAGVAIVAGWLPARRASRIDPLAALRHE
jgi:putative ABC transport system permease protein